MGTLLTTMKRVRPTTPTLLQESTKRFKAMSVQKRKREEEYAPQKRICRETTDPVCGKRGGDTLVRAGKRRFTADNYIEAMEEEIAHLRAQLQEYITRDETAATLLAGQAAQIRHLEFLLHQKRTMPQYITAY